jgi:hypothetical protein
MTGCHIAVTDISIPFSNYTWNVYKTLHTATVAIKYTDIQKKNKITTGISIEVNIKIIPNSIKLKPGVKESLKPLHLHYAKYNYVNV